MMTVAQLREKLERFPDDASVVLDTTVVLGNYDECLELSLVEIANDGSLCVLVTMPDKDCPQPRPKESIIL